MSKWIRISLIVFASIITFCILLIHISGYLMSYSDVDIQKQFPSAKINYNESTRSIYIDNNSDTLIVFIHGAPGDFSAFNVFLDDITFSSFNLLAYDRPGYGNSDQSPIVSIKQQSNTLLNIIKPYKEKTIILVGHSYGCAIAGNLAATHNELINKLIMIAPLLDPDNEPIFWFSYFGKWPLTKWVLTNDLQTCGDEKFAHSDALKEIESSWKNIKIPVLHMHGGQDALAPPLANLDYSKRMINTEFLLQKYYPEEGHLIMWEEYDLVKHDILRFIEKQ